MYVFRERSGKNAIINSIDFNESGLPDQRIKVPTRNDMYGISEDIC